MLVRLRSVSLTDLRNDVVDQDAGFEMQGTEYKKFEGRTFNGLLGKEIMCHLHVCLAVEDSMFDDLRPVLQDQFPW